MHHVIFDLLGRHRSKRSESDIEGDGSNGRSGRTARLHHRVGEMQPGGRRSHRTRHSGIDGLVPVSIDEGFVDVRGQGHHAALTHDAVSFSGRCGADNRDFSDAVLRKGRPDFHQDRAPAVD